MDNTDKPRIRINSDGSAEVTNYAPIQPHENVLFTGMILVCWIEFLEGSDYDKLSPK